MNKLLLVLTMFFAVSVMAAVPHEINYQGKLTEYGIPVTGTRTMRFYIFRSATGTDFEWGSGDLSVTVSSGAFTCSLAPDIDWRKKDFWIETMVSGKALSPREKLTAQPFALHSENAEGITKSDGETIEFRIGNERKASIAGNGDMSSLLNGTTYYMVPRGAIIMWAGSIATIPTGWVLCDGTNDTPNLSDRFILGVNSRTENPGISGGQNAYSLSVSQLPSHNHTATSSTDNSHVHNNCVVGTQSGGDWGSGSSGTLRYGASNPAGSHSHTITIERTGDGAQIDNRPAFYKLAFIMRL